MVSYNPVGRTGSASADGDQTKVPVVGSSRPTGEFRQLQLFKKLIPQLDGSGVPSEQPAGKNDDLVAQEAIKVVEPDEKPQEAGESKEKELDDGLNGSAKKEIEEAHKKRDSTPLVLRRGATGTVKWFSFVNGYGFINLDKEDNNEKEEGDGNVENDGKGEQGPQAIFVHASAIVTRTPRVNCVLMEGESVVFDIAEGLKGKEAIAVTGPGGTKAGQRKWSYKNRMRSQRTGRYDGKKKRGSFSEDEYASCHEEESQMTEKLSKLQLKKNHEGVKKRRASNGPSETGKDKRTHISPNKESSSKAGSGKLKIAGTKQTGRRSMQFSNKKATPALQKNFNQPPATN